MKYETWANDPQARAESRRTRQAWQYSHASSEDLLGRSKSMCDFLCELGEHVDDCTFALLDQRIIQTPCETVDDTLPFFIPEDDPLDYCGRSVEGKPEHVF